ncbi:MAG: DUF523 domain-containing protein [Firmicutes bacterium]|nr:DUF523 domain-containing protein [Candidatus Fermentithermobacillaceae bacterium]
MFLVSSCLCGNKCRYDGSAEDVDKYPAIRGLISCGQAVPVCPEVLGGLAIPRPAAEIIGGNGLYVLRGKGRVYSIAGDDVTEKYRGGSFRGLLIGLQTGCTTAILKSRSPACGIGLVYDGTFRRNLVQGDGVFAALLANYGFSLFTEETFSADNKNGAEGGI